MKYNLVTLENGLRVLSVPLKALASATLTIWVKTGSRLESREVNGISHFLEHMAFKGSKKRPTAIDIYGSVDAIGGEFNAGTSKDWTNYYIKARSSHLKEAFDVLGDIVLNPLLKPEEIEREKGVIIEEIRMHEDTPMMKIGDIFEELIFEGNSLAWDIAGEEKTVKAINRNDFVRYRKIHYHPENMLITVAGGISNSEVLNLSKNYFGALENVKVKGDYKKFKSKQSEPKVFLRNKKNEQAHYVLGFRGNGRDYEGRFAELVLSTILGGSASSRLFIEVRERRGLGYSIRTSTDRYQDTGYLATQAGVDVKRVDEAIKVTLDEHYLLADKKKPISKSELSKAKEYLKGHIALALEDTKDVTAFFGERALFLKKILTPEEVFKKIEAVTEAEVVSEARKLFKPNRLNLALIGPYEDAERFRKLVR